MPISNTYIDTRTYGIGELVVYQNALFRSLNDNNLGNTPEEGSLWWELVVRYDLSNSLIPGQVYGFKFVSRFTSLSGYYRLDEIVGYDKLAETEDPVESFPTELFTHCYQLAGLTQTNLLDDLAMIASDVFYKLIPVDELEELTPSYVYIPNSFLTAYPVFGINKYPQLTIGVNLGVIPDPETVTLIVNKIEELVATELGIINGQSIPLPNDDGFTDNNLITYDSENHRQLKEDLAVTLLKTDETWLSQADCETMAAVRDERKGTPINYYSESKRLLQQNTNLQSKYNALEQLFVDYVSTHP